MNTTHSLLWAAGLGAPDAMTRNVSDTLAAYADAGAAAVRSYCFYGAALKSVSMPHAAAVGERAFFRSAVERAFLPQAELQDAAFAYAPLRTAVVKSCAASGKQQFYGCASLTAVDFTDPGVIPTKAFTQCTQLSALVLRKGTVAGLASTDAFVSTPFGSGGAGGTVYIPQALYDRLGDGSALDYQADTNWSAINGYGTVTWAPIEGSVYETRYADGTPIGA